jgi:hypothetical protein
MALEQRMKTEAERAGFLLDALAAASRVLEGA